MSKITCFEDLVIWQKEQDVAVKIYQWVEENDLMRKDFRLKDQFRAAAISVSDNIAEGFEYNNNPDFYRFLRIAKGSCGELRNKLQFAKRLSFIDEATAQALIQDLALLSSQIGELMKKVRLRIKSESISKKTNTV